MGKLALIRVELDTYLLLPCLILPALQGRSYPPLLYRGGN